MQQTDKRPREGIEYRVHMGRRCGEKSALNSLPHLRQSLDRNRHGGLQLLGEKLYAQFLEQPAELLQPGIGLSGLRLLQLLTLPLREQRSELRCEARVALRIRAQLVQAQAGRLQVAREML